MKSKSLICLIILCVLFSLTAVSASDNQSEVISDSQDYHTFSELNQLISESEGEITLEYDYKCDGNGVVIEKDNEFTINGNNHVIDGLDDTDFIIQSKNTVTVNNLTFQNAVNATINTMSPVIFNNVKFINFTGQDQFYCILAYHNIKLDGCFIQNNREYECFIDTLNDIDLINTICRDSSFIKGFVLANRNKLIVENCTFENLTADVGSAINYKGWNLNVKKSKFLNLKVSRSGGAIIAKYFPYDEDTSEGEYFLIEDCEFVNASASNNGGAIYCDLDSGSKFLLSTLNIINSNFTDCKSKYGGAIVDLGGILNIVNSTFENNYADFEGGAIYTSWSNLNLINTTLSNNKASKNAGAIYFDKGTLNIEQSNLLNSKLINEADNTGRSIYAYDANLDFSDSVFDNGGVSVYADFLTGSKFENITKDNDEFSLDNKNYIDSVESGAMKINIINTPTDVDELPSQYDSRDYGLVSPEKVQGDNDDCWAFATAASVESALLKSTGVLYNLSQNYVQKLQLKYARNGDLRISSTGFGYSGLGYALSWYGVLPMDDLYDDRGMAADTDLKDSRIHLQDAMIILGGRNDTINLIKQAIVKYGSVSIQLILGATEWDIPTTGENISVFDHEIHFVSLIGWDDGINSFIYKDSLGGFSEVKYNSSLLDTDKYAIVPQNAAIAYIFENDIDYHVNYQTDLTSLTGFDGNYTYYSNEFTSKYTESIGAVGTYFNESGIEYSFDVYVNGKKVHTQSGESEFAGFRTIKLNEYVPVKANDTFKVVFKNNALPYQAYSRQHYIPGMSMISADGETWSDITLENKTVCLKVYTVADDGKDNDTDDKPTPTPDVEPNPAPDAKGTPSKKIQTNYNTNTENQLYTVYRASDMKVICHSNVINLKALIDLFKLNMTNGHLKVYIDGTLVFDDDVDDDLSRVIFEIIEKFLGKHEITVEFTDKSGKTQTLNETIIIE